jgi:hypothetical protein
MNGSQPRPVFSVRYGGYRRREVDDFLRQLAVSPELAVPAFAQRLLGYSVAEVDDYIAFLKDRSRP